MSLDVEINGATIKKASLMQAQKKASPVQGEVDAVKAQTEGL